MDMNWASVVLTLVSVIFVAGTFVGITRMSFKSVEQTLLTLEKQIQELKDDNRIISEISTNVAVIVSRVDGLEKCQDHLQQDMNILKKRNIKKVED